MYLNFEGLEQGEDIKKDEKNQKNLLPTLIYQFEHCHIANKREQEYFGLSLVFIDQIKGMIKTL